MKLSVSALVASLFIMSIAASPVPAPQAAPMPTAPPKLVRRAASARGEKLAYPAAERLRRNQVNPVTMRNPVVRFFEARWFTGKPSPSASARSSSKASAGKASPKPSPKASSWWKRDNGPSNKPSTKPSSKPSVRPSSAYLPAPGPSQQRAAPVCPYYGKQLDTDYCKEETTIDGCTHYSYDVTKTTLDLTKGNEFEKDGYVEFSYIPIDQYRGWGSAAQPDSEWKPVKAKIEFGSKHSTPAGEFGTDFVGGSSIPWDAAVELPEKGYCITWVKVSNFVQEYGINGAGPVCFCAGKKH